ncbi:MAG: 4,5-DOPA dioxygenase extradiol [Bacteroidota bacterium]|nr:4,5-DOPA dioxygenase extradiol [Bacteroidota bacterium]
MNRNNLNNLDQLSSSTGRMPVLFVGHGSPMYAVEENEFTRNWLHLGETLPRPKTIICVSAHWETRGTHVTAMSKPPTIHDFGGFPRELYEIQYPVSGNPVLAQETIRTITGTTVQADDKWGLDHGAWSVIRHMYPNADIPVIELSLDYNKSPKEHYELAKELASFRDKGVLIIGSGNLVHNLRRVAWDKGGEEDFGFDWALEANEIIKKLIIENKHKELIDYNSLGKEVQMAVPTTDHYLPLLYALALKTEKEEISFFNDKAVMGSLTMTSVKIG